MLTSLLAGRRAGGTEIEEDTDSTRFSLKQLHAQMRRRESNGEDATTREGRDRRAGARARAAACRD